MPKVNIGLGTKPLSTDSIINVWERVKDPVGATLIADEAISSLFHSPSELWEISRGISALSFLEFSRSGEVVDRKQDKKFISDAFRDGVAAAAATFWAIRNSSPKKDAHVPKFEIPADFEPSPPSTIFLPDHPNFTPIISRLIHLMQCESPLIDDQYDPYLAIGSGAEHGSQFMVELLALRHESLVASFLLEEVHLECRIPSIPAKN